MKKILCAFLAAVVLLSSISFTDTSIKAAGVMKKSSTVEKTISENRESGRHIARQTSYTAELMDDAAVFQPNTDASIRFEAMVSSSENGKDYYKGYMGYALRIYTGNTQSFYQFSEQNTTGESVEFALYDANKTKINMEGSNFSLPANTSKEQTIKLDAGTSYYMVMYMKNKENLIEGNVDVSLKEISDNAGDKAEDALDLTNSKGIVVKGAFEGYEDVDFYQFNSLSENGYTNIVLTNNDIPASVTMVLYNSDGVSVASASATMNKSCSIYKKLTPSATYFLKVSSGKKMMGNYGILITEENDPEHDTMNEANKIEIGKKVKGGIQEKTDIDYFRFNTGDVTTLNGNIANNGSGKIQYAIQQKDGKNIYSGYVLAGTTKKIEMGGLNRKTTYYLKISGAVTDYSIMVDYVKHKIQYNLNGGKNNYNNSTTYNETSTYKLLNPTRAGYAFKGWYRNSKYKDKITVIPRTETKNISVYAKWEKVKVEKTGITSSTPKSTKFTLRWDKVKGAAGYKVQISTSQKFNSKSTKSMNIAKNKNNVVVKGLKKNSTYYVRIKAFKKDSAGNKIYSSWSKMMTVKTKKK